MKTLLIIPLLLGLGIALAGTGAQAQDFLENAFNKEYLEAAIRAEKPDRPQPAGVSGITVPHHLIAPKLIARGFWAASAGEYDRIILLAPDHYRNVQGKFATSLEAHNTVFGPISADRAAVQKLLADPLFEPHRNADREHGTGALLPFIARFFPGVPVVTVLSSIKASPQDWSSAAQTLRQLVTPKTLIIQSTDYSHLLPIGEAVMRDQETLNVISIGDPHLVRTLRQADHLDSKASQFLQMWLQTEVFGAKAVILANSNSTQVLGEPSSAVTSYIVTAYHRDPAQLAKMRYEDQGILYFGGDVLLGRYLTPVLQNAPALAEIFNAVHHVTRTAQLVVNLEGVMAEGFLTNPPSGSHFMPARLGMPILRSLGVTAASLANNHAHDFGPQGHANSQSVLHRAGIQAIRHRVVADLGDVRVLGLNAIASKSPSVRADSDLTWICELKARPPLIVMLHWGDENSSRPGKDEIKLAEKLARCGVSAVIGTHSHSASPAILLEGSGMPWVFSTGNLLFDQSFDWVSGSLVEIRVFKQGTFGTRVIPIDNLFNVGRAAMGLAPANLPGNARFHKSP